MIPGTRPQWRDAASVLDNHLAPEADRCAHFSTDANDALAETNVTLFHTSDEIRGEFSKNAVGTFAGVAFTNNWHCLHIPTAQAVASLSLVPEIKALISVLMTIKST
ncbi:hypothetical protein [Xylella fastidiosa]|uniref:hypothetical protein n=1 Tax=Xylella fastidiosa TaxID=2371 RepID=UPI0034DFEF9B